MSDLATVDLEGVGDPRHRRPRARKGVAARSLFEADGVRAAYQQPHLV